MQQSSLAKWLKIIIIGVGICLTILCMWVIPNLGDSFQMQYPEYSCAFYPWLIFIWLSAIPCYIVLVFAWKIFTNIGKDESFTALNANYLKWISILAAVDSFFFFIGNVILGLLSMNHPGIIIFALFVVTFGFAITIIAAALSHLVMKAADLQTQSDLTI